MFAGINPGRVMVVDQYQKKWQKGKNNISFDMGVDFLPLPCDSNAFDSDYDFPTISARLKVGLNHHVTMHRYNDADWGTAEEVDYDSRMGNTVALFGTFARPLFRSRHWEADASLSAGMAYSHTIYDKDNNVDDELIGSHLSIYFGLGAHLTWRWARKWGLRGGVDYWHMSNGALGRPNKGVNVVGPSVAVVYMPSYDKRVWSRGTKYQPPFEKKIYLDLSLGVGAKTLYEEWDLTQFKTPKGEKDYRTGDFSLYMAYSAQADIMYRYARRWASGVGFDVFYGNYADRVEQIEVSRGVKAKHNPWSMGVAVKHEVFYKQLSLAMAVGWYLYREMGHNADIMEKRYYERIGFKYTIPGCIPLSIGAVVKAHFTKADYTELLISFPISLN